MADINTLLKRLGLNAGLASQIKPEGLSPEASQYYAQEYAKTGKLPSMGRGSQAEMQRMQKMMLDKHMRQRGLPPELAGASAKQIDQFMAENAVPPAYMGIDEDMGVLNELQQGIPGAAMPSVPSPNAVYDPKTGAYLGEYEFIPQNGLLYR